MVFVSGASELTTDIRDAVFSPYCLPKEEAVTSVRNTFLSQKNID